MVQCSLQKILCIPSVRYNSEIYNDGELACLTIFRLFFKHTSIKESSTALLAVVVGESANIRDKDECFYFF